MDFDKVCMMFAMQEPFYGVILSAMDKEETDKIQTFAVGKSGNVFRLYYNKSFFEKLSVDCVLQCLKHEMLHIAFNHFELWEPTTDEAEHHRRNMAEDLEVNCYLDRTKMDKEAGGLWTEDFGYDKNLGSRTYYDLLGKMTPPQQKQVAMKIIVACNGGKGGNEQTQQAQGQGDGQNNNPFDAVAVFDDHSMWPKEGDPDFQNLQQVIDELVAFAAEECEKHCGSLPGEMKGRIDLIRKKPRPVADWKRYFRRYLGNEFSEFIRKSKKRESKRFPDAAGNRHRRKSHILVGIDTSGSVSDAMVTAAYSEIKGAIDQFDGKLKGWLGFFDAAIIEPQPFENEEEFRVIRPAGGGGTDFQIIFEYVHQHMQDNLPASIIILTDGYAPFPKEHLALGIPVLWLLNNEKVNPPWGKVARIVVNKE